MLLGVEMIYIGSGI